MNDIQQVVETGQSVDSFDVLDFIQGASYPESHVVVFTDVASVKILNDLNAERLAKELENAKIESGNESESDLESKSHNLDSLTERINNLTDRINGTALKFTLKGMPPGMVEEIYPASDGEEDSTIIQQRINKLIAKSIVRVTKPSGAVDSRLWTEEDVDKLRANIQPGEFGKLVTSVIDVNFNAAVFDEATDAGFLSRSSNVAA